MLFALAVVAITQQDLWAGVGLSNFVGPKPAVAAFFLATSGALAWRRIVPVGVLVFVVGVAAVQDLTLGSPQALGAFVPELIAVYSVGRHAAARSLILAGPLAVAGVAIHDLRDPHFSWSGSAVFFWAILAAAWPIGHVLRRREEDVLRLAEHSRALESVRDDRIRAAIAEERNRIARELHDVVGHSVSIVVLQVQAALALIDDGDVSASRDRLAATEHSAREAMAEMRRLVGLIDDSAASVTPRPGLRDLDALVAQTSAAGARIEYHTTGTPIELSPGVDLAAFRVAQEALTNVLRHARPPEACLHVHYDRGAVTVEVIDRGGSIDAQRQPGRGIAGMRERVALYDGAIDVGPRPEGGFAVRARFPVEEAPR
jgi:signal transduction histidine kinase